uniref:Alpha11-takusan n=1 Tax=Mus musculus TaxID=10090 RepID=A6NAS8_MOUSE|nr:alpha11-takusan [Mus musculus]
MFSWLLRLFQKETGDEGETRPTEKEEGILSHEKGRRKSFWRRHRSARNTSTQNSKMTKKRSKINELEELKLDMRKISNDMEEMCGILNLYMYEDLNYRMNTEFNIIKSQHEKTMLDMNKMIQSIIGSMQYSKELIEDNYSYRALAGIIGLVGVASQWNLAGNHQFFFVDQH